MNKLPFEKERKIFTRKESETDANFGISPEKRPIQDLINYGVICINKPQGPTSHQTADYVKKILNISKCGHGGSLDPHVTGVLPVALSKATRITQSLLKAGKEYVCIMHLHSDVDELKIRKAMQEYVGKIQQMPPIKSAVKRQLRTREIYYIDILEIKGKDVLFKIGCQAGTYIRKYCHDFGKRLNTDAHMQELIRTKAGPFTDKEMYSLHDLQDAYVFYKEGDDKELRKIIKPIEFAVQHLPKIWVFDSAVDSLCHGSSLYFGGISKVNSNIEKEDLVAVLTLKNELVGLGYSEATSKELLEQEKGVAVKTSKVFMGINLYQKLPNKI